MMRRLMICYFLLFILNLSILPLEISGCLDNKEITNGLLTVKDSLYIQKIANEYSDTYKLYLICDSVKRNIYKLTAEDGSFIDFKGNFKRNGLYNFACYAIYDNGVDGNIFLFYDYLSKVAYITKACFSDYTPIWETIDFKNQQFLLSNPYYHKNTINSHMRNDTLVVDTNSTYVPINSKIEIVKAFLTRLKY